jgi:hypothetical protein
VKQEIRIIQVKAKKKPIPVTGRGGLQGWERLRIARCIDNRLTKGDKVDSLTCALPPESFLVETANPRAMELLKGLGNLKKKNQMSRQQA